MFRVTTNKIKLEELKQKIKKEDRKKVYVKKQLVDYNEFD
jgi:hypothetical protein